MNSTREGISIINAQRICNHRMYIYIMKWGKQKIIRTRPLKDIRSKEKDATTYSYCDDLNSLK